MSDVDTLPPDLPIAEAAQDERIVERVAMLADDTEISLGRHHASHGWAQGFERVQFTATVRHYRFRDIVLDAESMVLFKDHRPIPETRHLIGDPMYQAARTRRMPPARLGQNETIAVGYNSGYNLYYFWMTQCLPAIDHSLRLRDRDAASVRVVVPPMNAWRQDTLGLLGHGRFPMAAVTPGRQYRIEDAEYSQFLNDSVMYSLSDARVETFRRMQRAVPVTPSEHAVIYVRCTAPYFGRMTNEADLLALLRQRGVYIVEPGRAGLAARINLFRQAKVVIGQHGEGLTDILFCQPHALLWELTPVYYQNPCFNRLAQSARLDYWGDLFETDPSAPQTQPWQVDLDVVAARLDAIAQRLAAPATRPSANAPAPAPALPLDDVMLAFESLGDNCEFGLVQRHVGAEPLGLLRFAGMSVPVPHRCQGLAAALEAGFEGLGDPDTIEVKVMGSGGIREYVVAETLYGLTFHTFVAEATMSADEVRRREVRRLAFLRRKLIEDLTATAKIWVWKSNDPVPREQVDALVAALRRYGANTLLWVTPAATPDLAGTVERLGDGLLHGQVERFADYENVTGLAVASWISVCKQALALTRGTPMA